MPTSNSPLRRLRFTPMRDIVRLRLTGRLDLESMLNESGLPAPATACVGRVVRGTRLWRLEKSDVAQELIAHFRDGLAAGTTVEELLASFGDEKQAARLIRRAKLRNRPLAWHALRWARRSVAALVVFYIALAIYFYAGKPTISTDYLTKFNAVAAAVPKDQAAWPLYREALIKMKLSSPETVAVMAKAYPRQGPTLWDVLEAFVKEPQDAMDLIRRGTALPGMGFVAGAPLSAEDRESLEDPGSRVSVPGKTIIVPRSTASLRLPFIPPLFNLVMQEPNYLQRIRLMARLLEAEGKAGIDSGDGGHVAADIDAVLGLGRHTAERPLFLNGIVAISLRTLAIHLLGEALTRRPDILSRAQLRDLAHALAVTATLTPAGERMLFYDWVQRGYTDNGRGDGRLTLEGVRLMNELAGAYQFPVRSPISKEEYAALPIAPLVLASRKDLLAKYDQIMDRFEAAATKPIREVPHEFFADLDGLDSGLTLDKIRYGIVVGLTRGLAGVLRTQEQVRGMTDGAMIGIALELYRRDHGHWPDTLGVLAPAYMPTLPVDRITGGPLHYRIVNNQPLIYSVGVDRKDDGGRMPVDENGHPARYWAAQWPSFDNPPRNDWFNGDWVLWPVEYD